MVKSVFFIFLIYVFGRVLIQSQFVAVLPRKVEVESVYEEAENEYLKNIKFQDTDGWLILIFIGLISNVLTSFFAFVDLSDTLLLVNDLSNNMGSLLINILPILLFGFLAIITLVTLITNSKKFPLLFISYLLIKACYTTVNYAFLPGNNSDVGLSYQVLGNLVIALVWVSYTLFSKKVKKRYTE